MKLSEKYGEEIGGTLRKIAGKWTIDFNPVEDEHKIIIDTVCLSCGKVKYNIKKVKKKYLREILKKKKKREEFGFKIEKAKRLYNENRSKTCG
jgi:hypothetical protein